MTLSLTHDTTLQRVRIDAVGFGTLDEATLHLERSADQVRWQTVRGGVAVGLTGGDADRTVDDYEWPSDVTSHYRATASAPDGMVYDGMVVHEAWLLPQGASTPDAASLQVTEDLDVRVEVCLTGYGVLMSQYESSANIGWELRIDADGRPGLAWSPDGSATAEELEWATAVLADAIGTGTRAAIRATLDVDDGAGGYAVTFYTAGSLDDTWTQLGDTIVGSATTSIYDSTADVFVADDVTGHAGMRGVTYRAELRDGIDGTVLASPDFSAQPTGTTTFDDAQGHTWTLTGSNAEIITVQTATITPSLDGQVWLKSITRPFLNAPIVIRGLDGPEREGRGGTFAVANRSRPIAVTTAPTSRRFTLTVRTSTRQAATELDWVIASGDPLYLHIPPGHDLALPSMHVYVDAAEQQHINPHASDTAFAPLALVEAAPPDVSVYGTTATWQSVIDAFGSWADVVHAFDTWADVLKYIGDPSGVLS